MSVLSIAKIQSIFQSCDLTLSEEASEHFRAYLELLLRWNQRISLTALESPEEIVRIHFVESVLATKTGIELGGRLADVGTGAGFPGLPLGIYLPELKLTLIEPNAKKCAFLAEVSRALELRDVEIVPKRYEDVRPPDPLFDILTSRALGQFVEFLEWAETVLVPGGNVAVWTGPDGKIELERRKSWKWREPYVIPGSKRRLILVGSR